MAFAKSPGKGSGIPDSPGGNPIQLGGSQKNPDTIRGTCVLIEEDASISSPCVNLLIALTDEQGNEIERTRTSDKGSFKFTAERKKSYLIDTVSDQYEVMSPSSTIKGGDSVDLEVQEKSDSPVPTPAPKSKD